MLLASLPVITLAPALPVALTALEPVRVRFSTLLGKTVVTEEVRVSVIVVATEVVLPNSAFVGLDRTSVKVSSDSLTASLRIGMVIF